MLERSMGREAQPRSDFSQLLLDDWLAKFGRIYGKRHDKHTTEYMISRLVEEVAELVSPMEAQDRSTIGPSLADVFSWICSLAYKLKIDLSSLAWEKYGKNAPRPRGFPEPSISEFSQPRTLHEWQQFISKLYQNENQRLTPMNALVAMMKDVGDLAMLQRKRASSELITSKLAAILAWNLTLAELLHLDLAEVVFEKYDDHCPVCKQQVCDTDICHPFVTMYVSFGSSTTDEEKYVVLDSANRFGFRTLVDTTPELNNTRDLSSSLDLISRSDVACILLSTPPPIQIQGSTPSSPISWLESDYRQIFETMACFSTLSKGNVWIFTRDETKGLGAYLRKTFGAEQPMIFQYQDAGHLKALFEKCLEEVNEKRNK
jgi:NTP pyrophosphatase (non-canonical NTP hydrolase)